MRITRWILGVDTIVSTGFSGLLSGFAPHMFIKDVCTFYSAACSFLAITGNERAVSGMNCQN